MVGSRRGRHNNGISVIDYTRYAIRKEVAALTGYLCVTFNAIILNYRLGSEKGRDKHLNISEIVMRFRPDPTRSVNRKSDQCAFGPKHFRPSILSI
jgi:hypothetical protein